MIYLILKKSKAPISIILILLVFSCQSEKKDIYGIEEFKIFFQIPNNTRFVVFDLDSCPNCMSYIIDEANTYQLEKKTHVVVHTKSKKKLAIFKNQIFEPTIVKWDSVGSSNDFLIKKSFLY